MFWYGEEDEGGLERLEYTKFEDGVQMSESSLFKVEINVEHRVSKIVTGWL